MFAAWFASRPADPDGFKTAFEAAAAEWQPIELSLTEVPGP